MNRVQQFQLMQQLQRATGTPLLCHVLHSIPITRRQYKTVLFKT